MTTIWLAADYHFPSTYSCRVPMSSMSSTMAMPTPGPATVRLALLRTGMEYLGQNIVRGTLFPTLCAMSVWIRPPERVAISQQMLGAYKWGKGQRARKGALQESIMVREVAHASGCMTIYVEIPAELEAPYRTLLRSVGYWGQTDSLTWCVDITPQSPVLSECVVPFGMLGSNRPRHSFFHCVASEFRDARLAWEEVMSLPEKGGTNISPLRLDVYVWPLIIVHATGDGKLFHRSPFPTQA